MTLIYKTYLLQTPKDNKVGDVPLLKELLRNDYKHSSY